MKPDCAVCIYRGRGSCISQGQSSMSRGDRNLDPNQIIPSGKDGRLLKADVLDAIEKGIKDFKAMIEGKDFEQKSLENFYASMCKDIITEKKRMGGDWVVAQAVPSRALRDHIRSQLGPDLIFVVLSMPKEDQKARLIQRHGEESGFLEHLEKMDIWEPAEADEERIVATIKVTTETLHRELNDLIKKSSF